MNKFKYFKKILIALCPGKDKIKNFDSVITIHLSDSDNQWNKDAITKNEILIHGNSILFKDGEKAYISAEDNDWNKLALKCAS